MRGGHFPVWFSWLRPSPQFIQSHLGKSLVRITLNLAISTQPFESKIKTTKIRIRIGNDVPSVQCEQFNRNYLVFSATTLIARFTCMIAIIANTTSMCSARWFNGKEIASPCGFFSLFLEFDEYHSNSFSSIRYRWFRCRSPCIEACAMCIAVCVCVRDANPIC